MAEIAHDEDKQICIYRMLCIDLDPHHPTWPQTGRHLNKPGFYIDGRQKPSFLQFGWRIRMVLHHCSGAVNRLIRIICIQYKIRHSSEYTFLMAIRSPWSTALVLCIFRRYSTHVQVDQTIQSVYCLLRIKLRLPQRKRQGGDVSSK